MTPFTDWITGRALPVWADRGFDRAAGRFRERLDAEARPIALPHRAMVQARQVYVFAHAERLGWHEGGALAEAAMARLRRDFGLEADGMASFAFSVDPATGRVVSDVRDAYTHAFVLFAAAHLHALTGDRGLLALADRVTHYIERAMADPVHGGIADAAPAADATKRQNPHMHLLEAYLALEEAAPGRGYVERAVALVRLFRERMFSRDHGVLVEHFSQDWDDHPDPSRTRVFEPGHHYEWVWLLRQHDRLSGEDHGHYRTELMRAAQGHGFGHSGLILDELAADRRVTKPSHRLWPHTEAIKAAVVTHAQGDGDALPFAQAMGAALREHFLDRPFAGGWTDQLAPDLSPLVEYVPASSLYHLFLAAAEADAAFGERAPGQA